MAQHRNRRVILKTRATALPTPELFDIVEDDAPEPGDGEALIHNIYVTADPGMKGWISTAVNYASVETGATMNSFGVGIVVESNSPDLAEGDYVVANTGWQEYSVVTPGPIWVPAGSSASAKKFAPTLDAGRFEYANGTVVPPTTGPVATSDAWPWGPTVPWPKMPVSPART